MSASRSGIFLPQSSFFLFSWFIGVGCIFFCSSWYWFDHRNVTCSASDEKRWHSKSTLCLASINREQIRVERVFFYSSLVLIWLFKGDTDCFSPLYRFMTTFLWLHNETQAANENVKISLPFSVHYVFGVWPVLLWNAHLHVRYPFLLLFAYDFIAISWMGSKVTGPYTFTLQNETFHCVCVFHWALFLKRLLFSFKHFLFVTSIFFSPHDSTTDLKVCLHLSVRLRAWVRLGFFLSSLSFSFLFFFSKWPPGPFCGTPLLPVFSRTSFYILRRFLYPVHVIHADGSTAGTFL